MPTAEAITRFLLAFVLTQAIEVPLYVRLLRIRPLAAFGASAITHPIVWFVIPILWRAIYVTLRQRVDGFVLGEVGYFWGYGVLAEGFAVAVEAGYFSVFFGVNGRRALGASIGVNAASSLLGLVIRRVTGWP